MKKDYVFRGGARRGNRPLEAGRGPECGLFLHMNCGTNREEEGAHRFINQECRRSQAKSVSCIGQHKSNTERTKSSNKALAQAEERWRCGVSAVPGGVAESKLVNHSGTPDTTTEPLVARSFATPRGALTRSS